MPELPTTTAGSRYSFSEETRVSFRIRPGKKGLELRLHELEAAIMDVVWQKRLSSFAVSDVLAILEKQRDIAYRR